MDVVSRRLIADRYELRSLIGGGGMGEVYDALDLRLQRPVAVKVLRPGLVSSPTMVRRVEAETRLAARIHHPHVVAVFDAGLADGVPFIVMERLPGSSLRDRFEGARLADHEVREIGVQVLQGLAAAHELGVVHRDIKPSNVLLADGDRWKVADFGIATSLGAETTLTATGEVLGTPAYLAPERAEGAAASPASDIFSVGVLLYEAATGARPVERDDAVATVIAIREGAGVPLEERRPDLDPRVRQAIERALQIDPRARWPNAESFAGALTPAGDAPWGHEPTLRLTRDVPATERIATGSHEAEERDVTAVLPVHPSPPEGALPDRANGGDGGAEGPWRRGRSSRRGDANRALRITVGAALAFLLAVGATTWIVATAGDGNPPRDAMPTIDASVPEELRLSLDQLGEAIEP